MTKMEKPKYLQLFGKNDLLLFLIDIGREGMVNGNNREFRKNLKLVDSRPNYIIYNSTLFGSDVRITCKDYELKLIIMQPFMEKTYTIKYANFIYNMLQEQDATLAEEYKSNYNQHIIDSVKDDLLQ